MRHRFAQLRYRLRTIPPRIRMGALIAAVAIAGLTWQYYSIEHAAPTAEQHAVHDATTPDGHDHDGHALGEYQPDPSELRPPDFSPGAARRTAARFASTFASPNGNRDDWLARISGDVMPELLDQYRLTDIRNVPQTTVVQVSALIAADPAAPTFQVAYSDGSRVETTLEMSVDGWKVSTVVPVDDQPPVALMPGTLPIAAATTP